MIGFNNDAGGAGGFSFDDSQPFPSSNRGRTRSADFGLPGRPELLELARTYLETQARHWPDLVGTAAVPAISEATLTAMAEGFERRFRQQAIDVFQPAGVRKVWVAFGTAYLRFSDEGSNPRSLDQQLINVLGKAKREEVFVPWEYVCADAAVSGTVPFRRGFAVAKALVARRAETGVAFFLIDDLSRMSRNTIDSLKLEELVSDMGARLIGASDGFDSANAQSSLMLPMLSSMHAHFIDQLKSKVKRGMDDAFRRGENIQPPGVGYRMVPVTDAAGNVVYTHKGTVEKRSEIDPEAADWIRRGAEMIAHEGRSPLDVARLFNEHRVGGKQTWDDTRIRSLYARERLVGREVFRMTRQEKNRQTGKVRYVKLPEDQWFRRESPHLRILSDDLADAVRKKLNLAAQSFGRKATDRYKRAFRPEVYPKTLIRPICGGCGHPMILGRSSGKYQSFFCRNALSGIKGCTNRGYKSAKLIDDAVLRAVSATLFTEEFTAALTADVNSLLAEAASRPQGSTKRLENAIAARERQIARVNDQLVGMEGDAAIRSIVAKVKELQEDLDRMRAELVDQRRRSQRPPITRVKEKVVLAELNRLREVLQSDVGIAAPVLHALTGDVVLEARPAENGKRPEMFAKFTINALPALAAIGQGIGDDAPPTPWGYLHDKDSKGTAAPAERGQVEMVVPLKRGHRSDGGGQSRSPDDKA